MGYSEDKVNWDPAEHDAARNADRLYEIGAERLANGLDPGDVVAVPQAIGPATGLLGYLFGGGNRASMAKRFITVGVMLERDNDLLGADSGG